MTKITINSKDYNIPQGWKDITLLQYTKAFKNIDIVTDKNNIKDIRLNESKVLSRLLNEDDEFCMNLPVEIYTYLQDKMSFVFDIRQFITDDKSTIRIDGEMYELREISEMTLRNYIDVEESIKDKDDDEAYINLLAASLKKTDGDEKYDGNTDVLKNKLKNITAEEALPFVYHLLKKKVNLQSVIRVSTIMEEAVNQFA